VPGSGEGAADKILKIRFSCILSIRVFAPLPAQSPTSQSRFAFFLSCSRRRETVGVLLKEVGEGDRIRYEWSDMVADEYEMIWGFEWKQSQQKPGFANVNCCGSKVNVKLCRDFQHRDLCGKARRWMATQQRIQVEIHGNRKPPAPPRYHFLI